MLFADFYGKAKLLELRRGNVEGTNGAWNAMVAVIGSGKTNKKKTRSKDKRRSKLTSLLFSWHRGLWFILTKY